jgi:DNA-binding NtrC family response regulator
MTTSGAGQAPTVTDGTRTARHQHRPSAANEHRTVLVVDDDEPVRAMLVRLLRSRGHAVVQAANAREARARLEREQLAVVVTDIVMPGESGIELRRTIAREWPRVPVILVSGYSADAPAEFAQRTPLTWFVQKPFRAEQLFELLETALALARNAERDG